MEEDVNIYVMNSNGLRGSSKNILTYQEIFSRLTEISSAFLGPVV